MSHKCTIYEPNGEILRRIANILTAEGGPKKNLTFLQGLFYNQLHYFLWLYYMKRKEFEGY